MVVSEGKLRQAQKAPTGEEEEQALRDWYQRVTAVGQMADRV